MVANPNDGLPPTPDLVVVRSPTGAKFSVAAPYAPQFQGLIDDLAKRGVVIDPGSSGGYNRRFIAGTATPSEHSHGRAVDINWHANPQGGPGSIDPAVAREVAAANGMTWGGDWSGKSRDPMHFEIAKLDRTTPPPPAGDHGFPEHQDQNIPADGNALPVPPVSSVMVASATPPPAQAVPMAPLPMPMLGGLGSLGQAFTTAAQSGQQQQAPDQDLQPVKTGLNLFA